MRRRLRFSPDREVVGEVSSPNTCVSEGEMGEEGSRCCSVTLKRLVDEELVRGFDNRWGRDSNAVSVGPPIITAVQPVTMILDNSSSNVAFAPVIV